MARIPCRVLPDTDYLDIWPDGPYVLVSVHQESKDAANAHMVSLTRPQCVAAAMALLDIGIETCADRDRVMAQITLLLNGVTT